MEPNRALKHASTSSSPRGACSITWSAACRFLQLEVLVLDEADRMLTWIAPTSNAS